MNEWMKKNNVKVIYGLAIIVVILLIWVFSASSTSSREIARLGNANSALAAESAAKDNEIGEAKEKIDELTRDVDASKAEAAKLTEEVAKLTADSGELSEKAAALDASLSDAKVELDRLDFIALLREINVENLSNEVGVLRRVEVELKAEAAKLADEITKLSADNSELSGKAAMLDTSLSDAKVEIERLDFVALLREKNIEDLTNEVTVLKRVEAESKAENSKLAAAGDELSEKAAMLDASLEEAKAEIGRLDFVALLREKNIEELTNEVTVLRHVEVEANNEIVRLINAKLALEAESAAKSRTIAEEREKSGEMTRDYEASLEEAKAEIDRLDFIALLREKNIEDLTNEVTVLRQVEAESVEIIAELLNVIEAADIMIRQLEEAQ